jgi:hypothetical protein
MHYVPMAYYCQCWQRRAIYMHACSKPSCPDPYCSSDGAWCRPRPPGRGSAAAEDRLASAVAEVLSYSNRALKNNHRTRYR